jgi:hypothetical protein
VSGNRGITYQWLKGDMHNDKFFNVMTLPTREEHLIKTLKWLESRISTCPICIRYINVLREELIALRRSPAIEGPPEAIGRPAVR